MSGAMEMPDEESRAQWGRLNREGRYPEVQYGPTEPNGEPCWRVSLVNPAAIDFYGYTLSEALRYAEEFGARLVRAGGR